MPPVIPLTPALPGAPGRRRAGVATLAGVGVGVTLIWGSLTALNRFVLGFHAWPQGTQVAAQRLVVPGAPHRITTQDRIAAVRLLAGAGGAGGLRLVPSVLAATSGEGTTTLLGSGPSGPGGLSAPGVAGGVQGPSVGSVTGPVAGLAPTAPAASTDSDGDGTPDVVEQAQGSNPLSSSVNGQAPASGTGSTNNLGTGGTSTGSAKDPAGAVGDPVSATSGDGKDPATSETPPVADPGGEPDLGTTAGDPATPSDPPVATDPAPAPDPAPSPDPAPTVDPVTAPEAPIDPSPADAPAPPEPDTGGVSAPAETPAPATAT